MGIRGDFSDKGVPAQYVRRQANEYNIKRTKRGSKENVECEGEIIFRRLITVIVTANVYLGNMYPDEMTRVHFSRNVDNIDENVDREVSKRSSIDICRPRRPHLVDPVSDSIEFR